MATELVNGHSRSGRRESTEDFDQRTVSVFCHARLVGQNHTALFRGAMDKRELTAVVRARQLLACLVVIS